MRPTFARTALFAFSALLTCPSLLSQTFTFAPPRTLTLSSNLADGFDTLDLSGDGKTDLATFLGTGLFLYTGDGKGNFSNPVQAQLNDPNASLPSWYDVNGDGKADAVVAYAGYYDRRCGCLVYSGEFEVWLGDGKGALSKTTKVSLGPGYSNLVAGDFNKDGKLDFAVVTDNAATDGSPSTLTVFLNSGGGTFRIAEDVSLGTATEPQQIVTGDFNGDGKLDLAWVDHAPVANSQNRFVIHYRYGNGNGTFGPDYTYTLDGAPYPLVAADLNHDGKADLVVGLTARLDSSGRPVAGGLPRAVTLLGKSTGGFSWSSVLSLPQIPSTLSLQDLNGDGALDLFINVYSQNPVSYLAAGLGTGKFAAPQTFSGYFGNPFVAPLVKGGLPAIFYPGNAAETTIDVRVNTSKK